MLKGKFHSHQTIVPINADALPLEELAKKFAAKITTINTQNSSGRHDVMLTKYFHELENVTVSVLINRYAMQRMDLLKCGWRVIRTKIEHESLPSIANYTTKNYREIHIKLKMPRQNFFTRQNRLQGMGEILDFHVANNPKEVSENWVTQFVNIRHTNGNKESSGEKLYKILSWLRLNKYDIIETKREVVVYDSNLEMDLIK